MKNKIFITVVCIVIFCSALRVCAETESYLVKFKDGFLPDAYKYNLEEVNADRGIYSAKNLEVLKPIREHIEYTSENSKVTLIEGMKDVVPFSLRDSAMESEYAQFDLIHPDAGWKLEAYGNDIRVAVIDSGCAEHADLKNNLLQGKNYLKGTVDTTDNNGHGTHVAGVIAAEINGTGIAGIAPKAKIVPLKCFDPSQGTYVDDLLDAIYDAVDVYGCKVINMSWGLANNDPFLKEAIDYAASKGVIMIAAVGNYGGKTLYYPAAYDNVIGVASVGSDKVISSFSQYNSSVLVAALGESVKSTGKSGDYVIKSGTSQAAPMVSGVAAIAMSIDESLTRDEFCQLLAETAEDLGDSGYDVKYGYGLVNEEALVNKLIQNVGYYVSPVNVINDKAYVLIKNSTDHQLKATSVFSEYNQNKFFKCTPVRVTLEPYNETKIEITSDRNEISHFLWKDLNSLEPVVQKRIWKK